MSEKCFDGATALVTGGSRGIGRACCVRLGQAGANVVVNYRSRKEDAEETARLVEAAGGQAQILAADVSDETAVDKMVSAIEERFGPVELLVNNAGIFELLPHEQTTAAHWRRTMDVNLTGLYLVTWAVKDRMIERGYGRIVNVASIAGIRGRPMAIAYSVSKAGVIEFTKSAGEALVKHGIRINAVAPGLVGTEILDDVDETLLDNMVAGTPIPRMGQPREIADTVFYLLSDQSSFINGQTIVADGGRVMLP
ncbi:3-oxoacyl-[acyl-carrier-protein] reductase FabG [Symmachiella dynata]|uniref:SDR family NAD(P)-dependent oxidoreductase n=1 Tax=Symmachiella dynata TaxID=2527995 RepID=UPI001187BDB5|nr:3-oxoacyl-ACP reductase family protein [Symmachiella dynata]QDT48407.1 3-oxoacyl-[acyl-carrier-protein] reductase FabG [Symmachiella dynata]